MSKQLENKLAASLRQAKGEPPAPPPKPGAHPAPHARPSSRSDTQADPSPPATLDQPSNNLHPERIWPD